MTWLSQSVNYKISCRNHPQVPHSGQYQELLHFLLLFLFFWFLFELFCYELLPPFSFDCSCFTLSYLRGSSVLGLLSSSCVLRSSWAYTFVALYSKISDASSSAAAASILLDFSAVKNSFCRDLSADDPTVSSVFAVLADRPRELERFCFSASF